MKGPSHREASFLASLPVGLVVGGIWGPEAGLWAAVGCLAGMAIHPDLDQAEAHMKPAAKVLALVMFGTLLGAAVLAVHSDPGRLEVCTRTLMLALCDLLEFLRNTLP